MTGRADAAAATSLCREIEFGYGRQDVNQLDLLDHRVIRTHATHSKRFRMDELAPRKGHCCAMKVVGSLRKQVLWAGARWSDEPKKSPAFTGLWVLVIKSGRTFLDTIIVATVSPSPG